MYVEDVMATDVNIGQGGGKNYNITCQTPKEKKRNFLFST